MLWIVLGLEELGLVSGGDCQAQGTNHSGGIVAVRWWTYRAVADPVTGDRHRTLNVFLVRDGNDDKIAIDSVDLLINRLRRVTRISEALFGPWISLRWRPRSIAFFQTLRGSRPVKVSFDLVLLGILGGLSALVEHEGKEFTEHSKSYLSRLRRARTVSQLLPM